MPSMYIDDFDKTSCIARRYVIIRKDKAKNKITISYHGKIKDFAHENGFTIKRYFCNGETPFITPDKQSRIFIKVNNGYRFIKTITISAQTKKQKGGGNVKI